MEVHNVTLLGHKDHGKSTLIGSLMILTKSVTQTRINEAKEYSKRLHKSFEPAFILDSFHEEREKGLTIDTTRAEVLYKETAFSLIDVPGHEELIDNMISGASYANTAMLLVSAKKGEGIKDQTKRHLFIAKMLGIEKLLVAVNKMDLAGFSEAKFNKIERGLSEFARNIGFKDENVKFVPISAYTGEDIIKKSGKMPWYKGKPLLETLQDIVSTTEKKEDKPLRIVLQGFLGGERDTVIGRVVKGRLNLGENDICITPLDVNISVKSIMVGGKKAKTAQKGNEVAIKLDRKVEGEVRGTIICGKSYCPIPRSVVKARLFLTRKPTGRSTVRFNGVEIGCRIKPLEYIDPVTGNMKKKGRMEKLSALEAELELAKKIPAEKFDETKELGRLAIYSDDVFSGIGIII